MKTADLRSVRYRVLLFAFSHRCDVVAAVTNAGRFRVRRCGVPAGSTGTRADLDRRTGQRKAVRCRHHRAAKFEGKGENLSAASSPTGSPDEYRSFINELLAAHDIEVEGRGQIAGSSWRRRRANFSMARIIDQLMASAWCPARLRRCGRETWHSGRCPVGPRACGQAGESRRRSDRRGTGQLVPYEALRWCSFRKCWKPFAEFPALTFLCWLPVEFVTGRQMAAAVAMGQRVRGPVGAGCHHRRSRDGTTPCRKCWCDLPGHSSRLAGRTGKPSRQLVSDWTNAWAPKCRWPSNRFRFRCSQ